MLHATRRAVLVAVVAALTAGRAAAQTPTNTWTATASGNWSTASNWDTNSVPASAASTILQFNNPGGATYTATQDVANPFQLNGLIFNSPGGAVTVTNAAGNSLSLVANGGAPPFLVQNNAGAATLGNTGTVTFAAGPTFGGGGAGAVTVSSPVVFSGAGLVLNGFNTTTLSGAITLPSAALPITGNGVGSVAFTGAAGGTPTSVTVNTGAASFDTGFVQFSSATSSFTAAGGIALQSGNLILGGAGTSTAGPLGAPANVLTVTGGALRASAAATVFNPVTVGGTDLLYVGTVATTLNGAISVTGTAGLQVLGTGGLTVNNAAAFNGPTTVGLLGFGAGGSAANGSTLTVGSTATTTGSLLNTTAVTVNTPANSNTSGNLVLTNATAASNNRLSAAAPITLNGGRVTYVAASGANSQAFGAVTANGYGGIGTQTTNAGTALTFDSLALPNKATFAFRGSIGAGNNSTVTFTNGVTGQSFTPLAPGGSGTVPILPWAPGLFGTGGNTTALNSLVTTDGTNGVRVLNPASATDFAIAAAGGSLVADQNNYYGNAGNPTAIPANTTVRINSLVLNTGSITLAGGPGSVLQVFSGAVMTSGSGTIAVPTLDFGTHTGYLYPPSQMTMNAALTGSAGLVVAGYQAANAGTFLLLNAPNSVTGGLTVNGSVPVQFRDDRSLGAAGGGITLGGGTLQFIAGGAFALTRPVVLTPAGGALSGTGPNAIQSLITLDTSLVSGSGPLALLGGTVALSGIAGGGWSTFVSGGVVQFAGENNFGSGPITLNGGTLQPTTAAAFTRPLRVNASSTIDVGGLNPTFSGPISTLGYTAAAGTPPALTKAGTGTLTLTADSPFAGTVTVSAGGLTLGGATGRLAGAAAATVAAGASLTLDNTAANNNDRFAGPVTLTGGSFTLAGNSAGTAETIGTLSSTAPGSVVTIAPPAGVSALLKAASLNVPPAGTLVIRGTNLGAAGSAAALVFLTTPPTLLNGIIPGVVGDNDPVNGGGSFLVSYSSVAGVVPATLAAPTSMIQNAAPTNTPATANVLTSPGAATVQDQGNVINSLTLTAGTSLDAGGPLTLTMTSGMVVARAGGASTVGGNVTLASPAGTGLTVAAAGDLAALGPLSSGSGAVTKLGAGNLSLLAANTFTGTLTAGAGTVSVAAPTSAAGLAGSGAVAVATGATLTLTGTGTTTLFGPLSGAGSLLRTSTATGTQVLAGPVTLSGSLESDAGTLSLQTGVAAAASPIVIGGGGSTVSATLQVAPGLTISRGIDFQTGGGRALSMSAGAPGQPATTLAGQLTVESIVTLVVGTNNATYNVTGQVTGGGSIILGGASSGAGGTLNLLNGTNNFTGGVTLAAQAGTTSVNTVLGVGAAGALGTGTVFVSSGNPTNTAIVGGGYLQALGGPQTVTNLVSVNPNGNGGTVLGLVGTNPLTLATVDTTIANVTIDNRSSNGSVLSITTVSGNTGSQENVTFGFPITPAGNVVRVTTLNNGGTATVAGGVLQIQGTAPLGGGPLAVNALGTLGGTGLISRSTEVAGVIAPGTSVGKLNFDGPLQLDQGAKYAFEYAAVTGLNPGVNYDTIGSTSTLDLSFGSATNPFTVVISPVGSPGTTGGPVTYDLGTFTGGVFLPVGQDPNNLNNLFTFAGAFSGTPTVFLDPSSTVLRLSFTPVPEPGTLALAGAAAAAVACLRRRRAGQ